MNKIKYLPLIIVLVFSFAACNSPLGYQTFQGTITVTRNGIPWNSDNFPEQFGQWYKLIDNIQSRDLPPPPPPKGGVIILAHSEKVDNPFSAIGRTTIGGNQSKDDVIKGKYRWTIDLPIDELPNNIDFQIACYMNDIDILLDYPNFSVPNKVKQKVLVTTSTKNINLGLLNFNICRLHGNLPVTIKGNEPDSVQIIAAYKNYFSEKIEAKTDILSNGDWSFNVSPSDPPLTNSSVQFSFRVEARKDNYFYSRELNPNQNITMRNTDLKVVFQNINNIDF